MPAYKVPEENMPQVGLFWVAKSHARDWWFCDAFTHPFRHAIKTSGRFAQHPQDHAALLPQYQRIRKSEQVRAGAKQGYVLFDKVTRDFHVYLEESVYLDPEVRQAIVREFRLSFMCRVIWHSIVPPMATQSADSLAVAS